MERLKRAFSNNPLLRILPSFAAGIVLANEGSAFLMDRQQYFWGAALLLFVVLTIIHTRSKLPANPIFGILFHTLLLCSATALTLTSIGRGKVDWSKNNLMYRGVITERPKITGKTVTASVFLTDFSDGITRTRTNGMIQLRMVCDSGSREPKVGDAIMFYGRVEQPRNNGNPCEFDFAAYMRQRQIEGTAFVFATDWKIQGEEKRWPTMERLSGFTQFKIRMLQYREQLLKQFGRTMVNGQDLAVISALTLGDKSLLNKETKEIYSQTGSSHILALSGLHLGIVYSILHFLLMMGNRRQSLRICAELVIIVLMWCFVVLVGLPVSLVRAAVMYTMLSISGMRRGNNLSINNLILAAFILLLINPLTLYDVSFQLSFTAVFFILLVNPFFATYTPGNRIGKYLYSLTTVSVCAQMGVAPLVAYYFHSFPNYFLLTNVVVIPFTFVLLCSTAIFSLCSPIPLIGSFCGGIVGLLTTGLNVAVSKLSLLPGAVTTLYPSLSTVFLCYAILFGLLSYLSYRTGRKLMLMGIGIVAIIGIECVLPKWNRLDKQIVFYNTGAYPAIHFITSANDSYLWMNSPENEKEKMNYIASTFWKKENLNPRILTQDYSDNYVQMRNNIVCFHDKIIVVANDGRWNNLSTTKPLNTDYLYLSKNSKYDLKRLSELFIPKTVVIDSSVSEYWRDKYIAECQKLKWAFYDIKSRGALIVELNKRK